MKPIKFTVPVWCLGLLFLFSSCFEITEEFTITDQGSGDYAMKIDMYRMIEMISALDDKGKLEEDEDFRNLTDTTVLFNDIVAQSEKMTEEEKRLFGPGSMRMRMLLAEKDFYFSFRFPFENSSNLTRLYQLTPGALGHMDYDKLNGGENKEGKDDSFKASPSSEMASSNPYFEVVAGNGFFEKKLKQEEWKIHLEKDSTALKMTELMEGSFMTTVVHLPSRVKKCDHPYAEISRDRKTVTFRFPFGDYVSKPELLSFRIEY